jgi:hypothetical protein
LKSLELPSGLLRPKFPFFCDSRFLLNVCIFLPDYMASQRRRHQTAVPVVSVLFSVKKNCIPGSTNPNKSEVHLHNMYYIKRFSKLLMTEDI